MSGVCVLWAYWGHGGGGGRPLRFGGGLPPQLTVGWAPLGGGGMEGGVSGAAMGGGGIWDKRELNRCPHL